MSASSANLFARIFGPRLPGALLRAYHRLARITNGAMAAAAAAAQPPRHRWTRFEFNALVHVLTRGGGGDVATGLNAILARGSLGARTIERAEVRRMVEDMHAKCPGLLRMLQRQAGPKPTRALMRAVERHSGIGGVGVAPRMRRVGSRGIRLVRGFVRAVARAGGAVLGRGGTGGTGGSSRASFSSNDDPVYGRREPSNGGGGRRGKGYSVVDVFANAPLAGPSYPVAPGRHCQRQQTNGQEEEEEEEEEEGREVVMEGAMVDEDITMGGWGALGFGAGGDGDDGDNNNNDNDNENAGGQVAGLPQAASVDVGDGWGGGGDNSGGQVAGLPQAASVDVGDGWGGDGEPSEQVATTTTTAAAAAMPAPAATPTNRGSSVALMDVDTFLELGYDQARDRDVPVQSIEMNEGYDYDKNGDGGRPENGPANNIYINSGSGSGYGNSSRNENDAAVAADFAEFAVCDAVFNAGDIKIGGHDIEVEVGHGWGGEDNDDNHDEKEGVPPPLIVPSGQHDDGPLQGDVEMGGTEGDSKSNGNGNGASTVWVDAPEQLMTTDVVVNAEEEKETAVASTAGDAEAGAAAGGAAEINHGGVGDHAEKEDEDGAGSVLDNAPLPDTGGGNGHEHPHHNHQNDSDRGHQQDSKHHHAHAGRPRRDIDLPTYDAAAAAAITLDYDDPVEAVAPTVAAPADDVVVVETAAPADDHIVIAKATTPVIITVSNGTTTTKATTTTTFNTPSITTGTFVTATGASATRPIDLTGTADDDDGNDDIHDKNKGVVDVVMGGGIGRSSRSRHKRAFVRAWLRGVAPGSPSSSPVPSPSTAAGDYENNKNNNTNTNNDSSFLLLPQSATTTTHSTSYYYNYYHSTTSLHEDSWDSKPFGNDGDGNGDSNHDSNRDDDGGNNAGNDSDDGYVTDGGSESGEVVVVHKKNERASSSSSSRSVALPLVPPPSPLSTSRGAVARREDTGAAAVVVEGNNKPAAGMGADRDDAGHLGVVEDVEEDVVVMGGGVDDDGASTGAGAGAEAIAGDVGDATMGVDGVGAVAVDEGAGAGTEGAIIGAGAAGV